MIIRPITVHCDHPTCLEEIQTHRSSLDQAIEHVRSLGWSHSYSQGSDSCPLHTETARKVRRSLHGTRG